MANLGFALRALRARNYRLFFGGQSISLIGTWMTRIATSWLVYRLTKSAALLGVVGFSSLIASFLLGPIAGVWVDRWDRRRTLPPAAQLFCRRIVEGVAGPAGRTATGVPATFGSAGRRAVVGDPAGVGALPAEHPR